MEADQILDEIRDINLSYLLLSKCCGKIKYPQSTA